ncbi:MAG: DUF6788 family protein [Nitrospirales bacterium]
MQNRSTSSLRRRRRALLRRLPNLQQILKGSLIERYKPCGKPGCKCAKGSGHGPKYYLSISRTGQRPQMDYVPLDYHDQVEEYLANHRLVREIIGEISRINQELLRRRENL